MLMVYGVIASAMSGTGHRKLRLCSTKYYERRSRPVSLTVSIPRTLLRSDTVKDLQHLNMKLKSSESLLEGLLQDLVLTKQILFMYIGWEVLYNHDKLSIYQVRILGHALTIKHGIIILDDLSYAVSSHGVNISTDNCSVLQDLPAVITSSKST